MGTITMRHYHSYPTLPLSSDLICTRTIMRTSPFKVRIREGEITEVLKETSARRRWVALCWLLTWWVPSPCLMYVGRMKRAFVRPGEKSLLSIYLFSSSVDVPFSSLPCWESSSAPWNMFSTPPSWHHILPR